ncbi:restriction endonuclease subunit S [Candidatus Poseidoniales archaeon]|nr:restriction endonuclease subunit S [Candidatus Poseidoniales archaeon]
MNGGVCNLYELANWINGIAFRDIDFTPEGKPVIKIAEMKSGISENTGLTMNEFDEKYRVVSGDLLFSWSGSPKTSIFPLIWEGPAGWLNQHIFKVVPKEGISQDFLHLLLICLNRELIFLASNRMTTGLGHVTKSDLQRLRVNLPSKKERENIVRAAYPILSLESELKWTSDVNESIIQALFKSWFIDFDPVKAKSDGKLPYGMDEETAALFPDSFEDSKFGEIPEGWSVINMGEGLDLLKDGDHTPPKRVKEGIPFYSGKDVNNGYFLDKDKPTYVTKEYHDWFHRKWEPKIGDILIASVGSVGKTAIVREDDFPFILQRSVALLRPNQKINSEYLLYYMQSQPIQWLIESLSVRSVQATLSLTDIGRIPLLVPPIQILEKFRGICSLLHSQIDSKIDSVSNLNNLRETLLPRLMSGELELPVEA